MSTERRPRASAALTPTKYACPVCPFVFAAPATVVPEHPNRLDASCDGSGRSTDGCVSLLGLPKGATR